MRKFSLLLAMLALVVVSFVPNTATFAQDGDDPGTIADIVVASASADEAEFTILLAAVQAADPAVLEALSDPEAELTVFAPTDAAMTAFLEDAGLTAEEVLADQELLTEILLFHVVEGVVTSEDVAALLEENDGEFSVETLQGQAIDVWFTEAEEEDGEGSIWIDGAGLAATDIEASNGIIHVIDYVMTPEFGTIADVVVEAASDEEAPEFTTLLAAVQAADPAILEALSDPEAELTVFAPLDSGFAALLEELDVSAEDLLADTETLNAVLQYHVLGSEVYFADAAMLLEENEGEVMVETLGGESFTLSVDEDGNVMIDGRANIVITDIEAYNGVIHVIDAVIVPGMSGEMEEEEMEEASE